MTTPVTSLRWRLSCLRLTMAYHLDGSWFFEEVDVYPLITITYARSEQTGQSQSPCDKD